MTNSFRNSVTILLLSFIYGSAFGATKIASFPIEKSPPALLISATVSSQSCDTGIATVCYTVSGGIEPYIVTCQDQNATFFNATGTCFEDLPPGSYTISVADDAAETSSTTIVVAQPLTVLVNSTTPTSCYGICDGSVEITTNGGAGDINYLVNGVVHNYPEDFSAFCLGNHSAIAIDENSCTFDFVFEITSPQEISVSVSTGNATCSGMNDGAAIVAANGGTPPLIIEYANENLDFQNMAIGNYPFTVTDHEGCVVLDTIYILADVYSDFAVSIFTTPVSCWNEQDGTATALVTGGVQPIDIVWNDELNQTTETAIGLKKGTYEVEVTDASGCSYTESAVVELTVGCIFIADALTPNSDGYNDVWNIGGLEFFPEALVQVFNRWGQLVFESKGYNLPWNGTYLGKPLPVADYYYVITNNGTENAIQGTVTIKY